MGFVQGGRWCRTPSTWGTDPAVPGTAKLMTSSSLQVWWCPHGQLQPPEGFQSHHLSVSQAFKITPTCFVQCVLNHTEVVSSFPKMIFEHCSPKIIFGEYFFSSEAGSSNSFNSLFMSGVKHRLKAEASLTSHQGILRTADRDPPIMESLQVEHMHTKFYLFIIYFF